MLIKNPQKILLVHMLHKWLHCQYSLHGIAISEFIGGRVGQCVVSLCLDAISMKTFVYKVVLLGNSEVGKTTLFRKLIENSTDADSRNFVDSIELGPCTLEFTLTRSMKVQVTCLSVLVGLIKVECSMENIQQVGSVEEWGGVWEGEEVVYNHRSGAMCSRSLLMQSSMEVTVQVLSVFCNQGQKLLLCLRCK